MPYGLYVSAAGAEVQNRRLQVISNNLANVGTPGFKRELAVAQARHSEAIERGDDYAGSRSINDVGGGVFVRETQTDFSLGAVKRTGFESDLFLDDRGAGTSFFVVERDGERYLTRAGNFVVSEKGELQTAQGFRVLAADGGPVGRLEDGKVDVQALQLARPRSLGDLAKVGENLFRPLAPTVPVAPGDVEVRTGYLEQSTVNGTGEMMELIETSRAYEANIRMIQSQDGVLGTLLNRVLRQA